MLSRFLKQSLSRGLNVNRSMSSARSGWLPVTYIKDTLNSPRSLLRSTLNYNPEAVLEYLGLEPNQSLSCSRNLRVGNKGSLSVCIAEDKCGVWYNFETGDSGDMIDMIRNVKEVGEEVAFDIAKSLVEGQKLSDDVHVKKERTENSNSSTNYDRMVYLKTILAGCTPLEGTLGERYLKNTRKLKNILSESLQFHPGLRTKDPSGNSIKVPGLVAIASHPNSSLSNIQITYLDPKTEQKHRGLSVARRTFGSFGNDNYWNVCTLSTHSGYADFDTTYVCEGVETGLSVVQVRPNSHVIATLGKNNLTRLDPTTLHGRVVLVWDNDGVDLQKDRILLQTVKKLAAAQKRIYLVLPPNIDGREKTDLNDVLAESGEEEVDRVLKECMNLVEIS